MESGITVISNESLIISKEKKNNSIWNADLQLITLKVTTIGLAIAICTIYVYTI